MKGKLRDGESLDFVMAPFFETALVDDLSAFEVVKQAALVADYFISSIDLEDALRCIHLSE